MNPALYDAVRGYYDYCINSFVDEGYDLNSAEFLSTFPRVFIPNEEAEQGFDDQDSNVTEQEIFHKRTLLAAAFSPDFAQRTTNALQAMRSDPRSSDTTQFLELISDFICFAIPRCAGLDEESSRFDQLYARFEQDLYSGFVTVDAVAIVRGFFDKSGHFRDRNGFTLRYYMPPLATIGHPHLRDEMVPYLEFKRASCDRFDEKGAVLAMHYEARLPMRTGMVREALKISHEIIQKFVFAVRLVTGAPVYSDFRGYRLLGSWSAANFLLEHFWWERLDSNHSPELFDARRLATLLDALVDLPYDKFAVVDWKTEDALRRYEHHLPKGRRSIRHAEIEQLLDYIQAIEAILSLGTANSERIANYCAQLLTAGLREPERSQKFKEIFEFVLDMYQCRNKVAHGAVDELIKDTFLPKFGNKLNMWRLRGIVNELAVIHVANLRSGMALRKTAKLLSRGVAASLNRI